MHAEATSEKVALGWYLDGRVTAVVGTHTHVPTADARVLPGGTAYITDVGMTGARGGVIGVRSEQSIAVMRTHMPMRYDAADEDPWINAVLIRAAPGRRARRSSRSCAQRPKARSDRGSPGTMSRSAHCSRLSAAGPVPHHSSEPSESLACSEPCEPPPTWCAPPQSRNS